MRLSGAALVSLSPQVLRPGYARTEQAAGIVHFGIGAFHRAHQAWYTDLAMGHGDRNWGIIGVSLRSSDVAQQLNPQDGLYTVTERSAGSESTRLVGAVQRVLVAADQREAVVAALSLPTVKIVSFTVTEKGYCRGADGALDFDLAGETSFYSYIAAALARRRQGGLPGLTLLSCDNLADNGRQLGRLVSEYLDRSDPALRTWFEAECRCPSTMVDRIVPATTEADRADIARRIGAEDHGAVVTEPFTQWIIEDRFVGDHPRWQAAGAQFVDDVAPYEMAKLRMLNGAHSLLAYCGLSKGLQYVHEAVADPQLRALAERLMREEAAPTITTGAGQDLSLYAGELIARFANPALNHRLIQIAMDGSQKIPQRWLDTLAHNQRAGRRCPSILAGIAAWLRHIGKQGHALDDPRADQLVSLVRQFDGGDLVKAVFGPRGPLASQWQPDDNDIREISLVA